MLVLLGKLTYVVVALGITGPESLGHVTAAFTPCTKRRTRTYDFHN